MIYYIMITFSFFHSERFSLYFSLIALIETFLSHKYFSMYGFGTVQVCTEDLKRVEQSCSLVLKTSKHSIFHCKRLISFTT